MAFEQKIWVDRQTEHPGRRRFVATGTANVYDIEREEGLEIEAGDAFNAATMNDMERRIADGLAQAACNPNLLHNWYFVNPVNQRGQTEYTTQGYSIDRWWLTNSNGTLTVEHDGVSLFGRADRIWWRQYIENAEQMYGKQVTLSVIADGNLYSRNGIVPTTDVTQETTLFNVAFTNGNIALNKAANGRLFVQIHAASGSTVKYLAAKLELGSQQTLAHQDENDNWVLNDPPPDKSMELLKCIHSTADNTDPYANIPVSGYTYGTADIQAGTASPYPNGHLHFVIE